MPTKLIYQSTEIPNDGDDTVLSALIRHGIDVPHSCESGVCQSCMIRCDQGELPAASQKGLKATLAAQRYFLACQCKLSQCGDEELHVSIDSSALFVDAKLASKEKVAPHIAKLVLSLQSPIDYEPGQFVHLRRADGLVRSYSIASGPSEGNQIELHISRVPNGKMSTFLLDEFSVGDSLSLRGPSGDCFYVKGSPEQSMLLIGTGTGLAPLLGIVRSALKNEHSGDIHLYHGSVNRDGLYLVEQLEELANRHKGLHYHPCVDEGEANTGISVARAADLAWKQHSDLKAWRIFLCGHPAMVKTGKKRAYLAGASMSEIYSDPFEISS